MLSAATHVSHACCAQDCHMQRCAVLSRQHGARGPCHRAAFFGAASGRWYPALRFSEGDWPDITVPMVRSGAGRLQGSAPAAL